MNKLHIVFLTAIFFLIPSCSATHTIPYSRKPVVRMLDLTVPVFLSADADMPSGAGVILQHDRGKRLLILTAAHVILDDNNIESDVSIATRDTQYQVRIRMHVVRLSIEDDIALIASDDVMDDGGPEASVSAIAPTPGDDVYIVGSPRGYTDNVSKGIISSIHTIEGRRFYRSDVAGFFGNSGGPAFNEEGNVIGIVVRVEVYQCGLLAICIIPGSTHLTSLEAIRAFLY